MKLTNGILLGHNPDSLSFAFVDESDPNNRSESQNWPVVPSIGDVINTRTGILLEVVDRTIWYDNHLTIDVVVRIRNE